VVAISSKEGQLPLLDIMNAHLNLQFCNVLRILFTGTLIRCFCVNIRTNG